MVSVKPIKSKEKLAEIQTALEADYTPRGKRIFLLFVVGIYTGLRISDIVPLKVGQCKAEYIVLIEKKTGKKQSIFVNPVLKDVFRYQFAYMQDDDYLFPSTRLAKDGTIKHITTQDAYNDLKQVYTRFGLDGAYGCHTMRKTFGYWHYKENRDLEALRQHFNHATMEVTRRYIGIDEEEKQKYISKLDMGFTPRKPPENAAVIKRGEGEPVIIQRLDRTKQGRNWGKKKAEAAKRRKAAQDRTGGAET